MLQDLQQKVEAVEAKTREFERLGARLNEAQRMVAGEADYLVRLREQLSAILKRQYWDTMVGSRTANFGQAPAGRPGMRPQVRPGQTLDKAAEQQVTAAVEAAMRKAADLQDRLAALLESMLESCPAATQAEPIVEVTAPPAAKIVSVAATVSVTAPQAAPDVVPAAPHDPAPEPPRPAPAPVSAAPLPAPPRPVPATEPDRISASAHQAGEGTETERLAATVSMARKALADLDLSLSWAQEAVRGGAWPAGRDPALQAAREATDGLRRLERQAADLDEQAGGKAGAVCLGDAGDRWLAVLSAAPAPLPAAISDARRTYHHVRSLCGRLQRAAAAERSRVARLRRGGCPRPAGA
jgi:hypothetical protein